MGQHPSKGGKTVSTPSDKQRMKQVLQQQQRQREAHAKHSQNAKKLASEGQSEVQKSVLGARQSEETPLLALSHSTGFSLILLRRLQVLFKIISSAITCDNVIDHTELSSALGLSQSSLLFLALFRIFDATQTHKVNFRTWVLTLYNLSPQASFDQKCRFSFSLLDLNGDGAIESQELVNLLKNVIQLSTSDPAHSQQDISDITEKDIHDIVDAALKAADLNGDGEISYDEYHRLMRGSKPFYAAFTIDLDHLCAAFTNPEVRAAVLLSPEEALKRAELFRQKKYQQVIRESFTVHVVPFMQRLSVSGDIMRPSQSGTGLLSPGGNVTEGSPQVETMDSAQWNNFQGRGGNNNNTPASANRPSMGGRGLSVTGSGAGPNDHFLFSPLNANQQQRQQPFSPTGSAGSAAGGGGGGVTGTVADLVRMRTMSGIKTSAIVPSTVAQQLSPNILSGGGDNNEEEWHLIDDPFAAPAPKPGPLTPKTGPTPTISNHTRNPLFNTTTPNQLNKPGFSSASSHPSDTLTHSTSLDGSAQSADSKSYEIIGDIDDGTPVVGAIKPLPKLALPKDIPNLERKYSEALERRTSSVTPSMGARGSVTGSTDAMDIAPSHHHGRIIREKSESSLLRPSRQSLSQSNLPPVFPSSPQLQHTSSLTNSLTNHRPTLSTPTFATPDIGQRQLSGSNTTLNSKHGVYDFGPSPASSSEQTRRSPFAQAKQQQLDLVNLPSSPGIQEDPTGLSTHVTLVKQAPLSPPINHLLLADLHTISEDGGATPQATPIYITAVVNLDKSMFLQHHIIYYDNTKEPVKYIVDLIDLDIEVEEIEEHMAMEQTAAPALARLLAALREDNPWD